MPKIRTDIQGVNMSNKQGTSAFGVIITIVVIIMVARCMFCDNDVPSDSTTQAQKPKTEHDAISAWVMCQEFVKRNLKSPSSADFGGLLAGDYQDPNTHAIHMGDGVYECNGFVDAQNSFGAMIRNQFGLTIKYTGNDNWRLLEGPVIQ